MTLREGVCSNCQNTDIWEEEGLAITFILVKKLNLLFVLLNVR